VTPEERFTKIENLLQTLVEKQVEFEIEHGKIQTQQRDTTAQLKELAGSVSELTRSVGRVAAAQELTETRLQSLIDLVDQHERRIDRLEGR